MRKGVRAGRSGLRRAHVSKPTRPKGSRYVFMVPNNASGRRFVEEMRAHVNSHEYSIVARGSHRKPEAEQTRGYVRQKDAQSLRIYIEPARYGSPDMNLLSRNMELLAENRCLSLKLERVRRTLDIA